MLHNFKGYTSFVCVCVHACAHTLNCLVVSDFQQPHGLQLARLLCPWGFSRQEYWSRVPCVPPGDLPNPGIKPRSPTLQADSLPSEPPGKPMNTEVGSHSLLQGIFLTQESNWGLLHCRQILDQLSYQESPYSIYSSYKILAICPVLYNISLQFILYLICSF